MTPDDTMKLIAEAQRDAIWDTPEGDMLEDAPEVVYRDLAARLVWELKKRKLTIVPEAEAVPGGRAAMRIFDTFTRWLGERSDRTCQTGHLDGRFGIIMTESGKTQGFFQGESVQDAYAQAAQTISFNGGTLDDEEKHTKKV